MPKRRGTSNSHSSWLVTQLRYAASSFFSMWLRETHRSSWTLLERANGGGRQCVSGVNNRGVAVPRLRDDDTECSGFHGIIGNIMI